MSIRIVDHINIATPRLEETRRFYVDVLGLREGYRPASIAVEGYWLYAGERPIVHMQTTERDVVASTASALNHFAFDVDDLDALVARLERADYPFRRVDVAGTRIRQAFLEDPAGVRLELNENPDR